MDLAVKMDIAIKDFCNLVEAKASLDLEECGISTEVKFFHGRSVTEADKARLRHQLSLHPALQHLPSKRHVTKHDLSSYRAYLAGFEKKPLLGGVTLVTCNNGLLECVGRENAIKPYGIVSSVDQGMRLDAGVAKAVKDKFGGAAGNYNRVSQQRQNRINYGECFTYDSTRDYKTYDVNNCQTIHNVLVPLAADWNFEAELKNTFLEVFKAADRNRVKRVFCPLLGCGRAGGTGKALAKAVSEAKTDFEATGKRAPELILVGMSSNTGDKAACRGFERKWNELARPVSSTRPPVPGVKTPLTRTSPIAGASASSSVARPSNEKTLPGRVTMVTCKNGLLEWAGRENGIKPYGIVSSVDQNMQLDTGVAKIIKDKFGGSRGDYNRVSQQPQNRINYGGCFTYDCGRGGKPSDLSNCQTVHNVSVPLAGDRNFKTALKNTFLEVFKAADRNRVTRVFCPLLGCGRAGGTGEALAQAASEAKVDFEATGKQAPELILVGLSSNDNDKTVCRDFTSKWNELGRRIPSTRSPGKMPSSITSTGAATATATTGAGSGYNKPRELINGQLEVVMNADKGMFGYAKELSKQGVPFDLVNAANREMKHGGGIAEQFSEDLGKQFDLDTGLQAPVPTGSCYTTRSYGYAWDPKFGLRHCQYIHNVVAPNVEDYTVIVPSPGGRKKRCVDEQRYHQDFTNAFVSLLLEAHKKGSNTIVSCFIGCAVFGGSGTDMARALHAAYQDPRIQALPKVPKLILVGWKDDDWQVHEEFIQIFDSLNTAYPLHLPSGRAPARPSSTGISGTAFPPGSGAIRKKPSPYSPSGAGLSPRLRPASPFSTPADSLRREVTARTVSHSDGVLGYALKCAKNTKPFSLVNAVHSTDYLLETDVASKGGLRVGYSEHMLNYGLDALVRNQYYQCEAWDYKHTDGYRSCEKIHSVLFPQIMDRHGFSKQLIALLMNASPGERLLFPLYELEGVTESALNDVLNRAYSDPQVLLMAEKGTLPKLYVVRKTPALPMADDDFAPMAAGSRLDRSRSKSMHTLFDDHDSTRRSASPDPAAPFVRSSSRYGMWDSTTPDSGRDGDFKSIASGTRLEMPVHDSTVSSELSKLALGTGKTDLTSGSGKLLSGDGTLSCLDSDDPMNQNTKRFIQAGIDAKVFKKVQVLPAEISSDADVDVTSLEPYHKHKYGQLLSYTSRGKTQYISVDGVQGVLEASSNKDCFVCPKNRIVVYGTLIGNQPKGNMKVSRGAQPAAGYEAYGHIRIEYHFKDGMQTKAEGHPNPGVDYTGTKRVAFLPDNPEGNKVLGLLRRAFDQKLTFTIGRSNTTGNDNVVTWNEIHHKTSLSAPAHEHGYLGDSGYLKRVKEELKDRGIE